MEPKNHQYLPLLNQIQAKANQSPKLIQKLAFHLRLKAPITTKIARPKQLLKRVKLGEKKKSKTPTSKSLTRDTKKNRNAYERCKTPILHRWHEDAKTLNFTANRNLHNHRLGAVQRCQTFTPTKILHNHRLNQLKNRNGNQGHQ